MNKIFQTGYQGLVLPIINSVTPIKPLSLGVAIGVFIGLTPTVGIQMYIVATLWVLCRYLFHFHFSLPAGMAFVWISNPITIVPFYYAFLLIGNKFFQLMQWGVVTMDWQTFQYRFVDFDQFSIWQVLWEGSQFLLVDLGIPILVGSFILAIPSAIFFYFITTYLLTSYRKHKAYKANIIYEEWRERYERPLKSIKPPQRKNCQTSKTKQRELKS